MSAEQRHMAIVDRKCSVDGCEEKYSKKGYCLKHYHRVRRHGSTDVTRISGDNKSRIIANVNKRESGCWEWKKYKKNGYGVTVLNGRQEQAHRASWKVFVGDIKDGMQINHKCNNRSCINPDHLYQGTQLQNMLDMKVSGRENRAKGERSGMSKLTVDSVMQIKRHIECGASNVCLSEKFCVAQTTISAIRNNKTWVDVNL